LLVTNKHTKLEAFTVMELVIGLAISSIIISMVYLIYSNISKQVIEYSVQQDELMEYNQFQNVLSADIRLCKQLIAIDKMSLRLAMADEKIHYFFEKEYSIRKGKTQDTFRIQVKNMELSSKDRVEEDYQMVRLKTTLLGQEIIVFEEKKISLAERLNNYFLSEY